MSRGRKSEKNVPLPFGEGEEWILFQRLIKVLETKIRRLQKRLKKLSEENAKLRSPINNNADREGDKGPQIEDDDLPTVVEFKKEISDVSDMDDIVIDPSYDPFEEPEEIDFASNGNNEELSKRSKNKRKRSQSVESLKNFEPEPTNSKVERNLVDFLDYVSTFSISNYSKSGQSVEEKLKLENVDETIPPFHIVLKKKLDSFIKQEINMHKNVKQLKKAKRHFPQFFSKPPPTLNPQKKKKSVNPNAPDYICDKCNNCFTTSTSLSRHSLVHSEKTKPCNECGKMFRTLDDLNRHNLRVHQKKLNYKCSMCKKAFADSSGLGRHERSHLRIKKYLCNFCSKQFAELRNLRLHIDSFHSGIDKTDKRHRVKIIGE